MSIFVTSDTHFNNSSIIKYCNRPFADSDEQTAALIANWNAVVSPSDTVICCGDFIMGDPNSINSILSQLNGNIILTRGNHDTPSKIAIYEKHTDKITIKDIHFEHYKSLFFIFNHFPLTNPEFIDMIIKDNSEIVVCHGHLHDKLPFFNPTTHSFNCCTDVTSFAPVPLSTIYSLVKNDFIARGTWKGAKQ